MLSVFLSVIEYNLKPKAKTNPTKIFPEFYIKFLKVFSCKKANKLLSWRLVVDHVILMQPGIQPTTRPLNGISRNKLEVLKKYLKESLSNEYI